MTKKLLMMGVVLVAAVALVFGSLIAADSVKTTEKPATPAKADTQTIKVDKPVEAKGEKPAVSKFAYVGDGKCKLCHKPVHDSWATTVHAKAWAALKPEEQKKDECIGCHSTGKDAAGTLLTGVQCESCHGPGSAYKTQTIMRDKKQALANGLIEPTKEVCVKCHNEKSPTFKGFEFDKYVKNEKAMHKHFPKKTEEKKG